MSSCPLENCALKKGHFKLMRKTERNVNVNQGKSYSYVFLHEIVSNLVNELKAFRYGKYSMTGRHIKTETHFLRIVERFVHLIYHSFKVVTFYNGCQRKKKKSDKKFYRQGKGKIAGSLSYEVKDLQFGFIRVFKVNWPF